MCVYLNLVGVLYLNLMYTSVATPLVTEPNLDHLSGCGDKRVSEVEKEELILMSQASFASVCLSQEFYHESETAYQPPQSSLDSAAFFCCYFLPRRLPLIWCHLSLLLILQTCRQAEQGVRPQKFNKTQSFGLV